MWPDWWQYLYRTLGTQVKHVNHYTQVGSCQRRLTLIILLYFNLVTLKDASCTQLVVGFCYILIILQGCGNTAMLCLSPGKLSEKSYLSVRNPTCPVLFNIRYLETQLWVSVWTFYTKYCLLISDRAVCTSMK
jgi:hypothetical protein